MIKINGISSPPVSVERPNRGTASAGTEPTQAGAGEAATPAQEGTTVSLSARAADAAALLTGASETAQDVAGPELQRLSQAVADGTYKPEAAKVAQSLLAFERLVARKLGSD